MERRKGAIIQEVIVQGWFHEFEPTNRDRRVAYRRPVLFEMDLKQKDRWCLMYRDAKNRVKRGFTGPFKTKQKAIEWYNGGGR